MKILKNHGHFYLLCSLISLCTIHAMDNPLQSNLKKKEYEAIETLTWLLIKQKTKTAQPDQLSSPIKKKRRFLCYPCIIGHLRINSQQTISEDHLEFFYTREGQKEHASSCCSLALKQYKLLCPICFSRFSSEESFQKHIRIRHVERKDKK